MFCAFRINMVMNQFYKWKIIVSCLAGPGAGAQKWCACPCLGLVSSAKKNVEHKSLLAFIKCCFVFFLSVSSSICRHIGGESACWIDASVFNNWVHDPGNFVMCLMNTVRIEFLLKYLKWYRSLICPWKVKLVSWEQDSRQYVIVHLCYCIIFRSWKASKNVELTKFKACLHSLLHFTWDTSSA